MPNTMEEINSTITSIPYDETAGGAVAGGGGGAGEVAGEGNGGVNGLFDSSQDDYFRLYEIGGADADDDGIGFGLGVGGDVGADADDNEGMSNFIVGIWNSNLLFASNQTSGNSSNTTGIGINITSMNSTYSGDSIATWTSATSMLETFSAFDTSLSPENVSAVAESIATFTAYTDDATNTTTTNTTTTTTTTAAAAAAAAAAAGSHLFRTVFQTVASADTVSTISATTRSTNNGGNYGSEDVDIALIDSVETALDIENDYGETVGFNGGAGTSTGTGTGTSGSGVSVGVGVGVGVGIGGENGASELSGSSNVVGGDTNEGNLLHQSIAYDSGLIKNDSLHQSFDGGGIGANNGGNSGSTFMLLLEDFGDYFYNYNGSAVSGTTTTINNFNNTILDYRTNCTNLTSTTVSCYDLSEIDHNYWALILILFPILTLFGNILVILSVCRERSLQTVTNYFIVSLAIADLLVAVVVMPFAVYALFNGIWALPDVVCDFYIAMDVICSTSSIFNLVAISIDRYIAVTQPIKYAKHKNSRRVCLTILLVWAISAAIGSPIVLGLNNTPNRDPDLCVFYNTDFIVYSSLSSFYIPCIIMVFLYWNIFKALRSRARKQRAARKPHLSELTGGSVIENIAQTRRLAETALDNSRHTSRIMPDEQATNTASGSNEEEDENAISPDIDDCHVIVNDKSTEFMLATVVEETGNVVAQITSQPQLVVADPNGNHDSGYAPSNVDDVLAGAAALDSSPPDSPILPSGTTLPRSSISSSGRQPKAESSPKREPALSVAMKPLSFVRYGVQEAMTLARNDSTISSTSKTSSRKDKKNSQASRFTIYKVHKASKKKREKSSAKKERKATKTLAIVLGVFLFCWVPFFTCNIMDAMCAKFEKDCRPGVTAFILTTWLGYINSFVNPVIYTIFNPEFRKAFKKIMHLG